MREPGNFRSCEVWAIVVCSITQNLSRCIRHMGRFWVGQLAKIWGWSTGYILPWSRDQVALYGQGNRFELWDEALWNDNREQWLKVDETAEALPPELESLSL